MHHCCLIPSLPSDLLYQAAQFAWRVNPCNRPGVSLEPARISVMTTKWWGPKGVHLTVGFMEQIQDALADKIISYMNVWSKSANIKFSRTKTDPQVRISRGKGGYWSYLGTDILHVPKGQQTMNLEGFTLNTPDSEFARVIPHETFHTCGGPHEHMRKELVDLLDPSKTTAYFQSTQGWTAEEVRRQVLTPLDEASLMGTPPDQTSIMCYQIPGQCTKDGHPILGGSVVNQTDFNFAAKIYPKDSAPPEPPVPPSVSVDRYRITLEVSGQNLTVGNFRTEKM